MVRSVPPSIALIRSLDHGATWSAPIQISVPHHPARSGAGSPVIAACGAGVTIAWTDDGVGSNPGPDLNSDLFVIQVLNGVPGAPIHVTDDTGIEVEPELLVNPQGTVYLSWTGANGVTFASLPNCATVAQ